jgi:hypothetical protein
LLDFFTFIEECKLDDVVIKNYVDKTVKILKDFSSYDRVFLPNHNVLKIFIEYINNNIKLNFASIENYNLDFLLKQKIIIENFNELPILDYCQEIIRIFENICFDEQFIVVFSTQDDLISLFDV